MSKQAVVDMLDDNDSTRVKLRLAARLREADRMEADAERAHEASRPPSAPDAGGDVPLGGYL